MTHVQSLAAARAFLPVRLLGRARDLLNATPYSVLALFARAATFSVFFRSGLVKLSDWDATLMLFANEYRVPLLPPEVAAYMSAAWSSASRRSCSSASSRASAPRACWAWSR